MRDVMAERLVERPKDIEARVRDLAEMTSWSPVPAGSLLRVPAYRYEDWGIRITRDNREWLVREANNAYRVEWAETDQALNALVGKAATAAGIGDVNAIMNARVGRLAAMGIAGIVGKRGCFVAADIGAGAGATSLEVLKELRTSRVRAQGRIILIEPSESRCGKAVGVLMPENNGLALDVKIGTDIEELRKLDGNSVDIAYSNAAIHHNAFNYHLDELRRVLVPGGAFVNGDWHESMWYTPARAYWMLALLRYRDDPEMAAAILDVPTGRTSLPAFVKDDDPELRQFRDYFNLGNMQILTTFYPLTALQRRANEGIMRFWLAVGREFSAIGQRAPIFFLEAHETIDTREANLRAAGFEQEEGMEVEQLRMGSLGELAAVGVWRKS